MPRQRKDLRESIPDREDSRSKGPVAGTSWNYARTPRWVGGFRVLIMGRGTEAGPFRTSGQHHGLRATGVSSRPHSSAPGAQVEWRYSALLEYFVTLAS